MWFSVSARASTHPPRVYTQPRRTRRRVGPALLPCTKRWQKLSVCGNLWQWKAPTNRHLHLYRHEAVGLAGFFTLLYLFFAGLALDWLVTLHYRYVSQQARWAAAATNLAILVATLTVFRELLGDDSQTSSIISYSLGATVGCWIGVGRKGKQCQ